VKLVVRKLDDAADRTAFACGVDALDDWIRHQAGQAQRKRLASVWIATPEDRPAEMVGYYSLAPMQIAFEDAPPSLRKKLPRYPITVSLIARLAIDLRWQRQGMGGVLVVDALARSLRASEAVPTQAVVVHAKDDAAAVYYKSFGFQPFPARPLDLFLPMASVAAVSNAPLKKSV